MKLNFIKKFLFDKIPIRGAYLELDSTWAIVKNQKDYPDGIKQVLGELIAVNILLSTNLKIKGKIATQIQNSETIDFIVSEYVDELFWLSCGIIGCFSLGRVIASVMFS